MAKEKEKLTYTKEDISSWKKQYGKIFKTSDGSEDIIYLRIKRSEYIALMDKTELLPEESQDPVKLSQRMQKRQDGVCTTCVLFPPHIDILLEESAGLSDNLSQEIMAHSGFGVLTPTEEL